MSILSEYITFILYIFCVLLNNITITAGNGAIIGNGQVILGVSDEAFLNVPYESVLNLPSTDPTNLDFIALRNGDINNCQGTAGAYTAVDGINAKEGWSMTLTAIILDTHGFAHSTDGKTVNATFSGTNGGNSATSTIIIDGDGFPGVCAPPCFRAQVIHDFHPSAQSIYAYEVDVTVTNFADGATLAPPGIPITEIEYIRRIDWDITPTTPIGSGLGFVSIRGTDAGNLIQSNDNGACPIDQLCTGSPGTEDTDFDDIVATDHGSSFYFHWSLPNVAACPQCLDQGNGIDFGFKIFYGAAPGECETLRALNAVGAEVASWVKSANHPDTGLPYTFFIGFANVGGSVIDAPETCPVIDVTCPPCGIPQNSGPNQPLNCNDDACCDGFRCNTKIGKCLPDGPQKNVAKIAVAPEPHINNVRTRSDSSSDEGPTIGNAARYESNIGDINSLNHNDHDSGGNNINYNNLLIINMWAMLSIFLCVVLCLFCFHQKYEPKQQIFGSRESKPMDV